MVWFTLLSNLWLHPGRSSSLQASRPTVAAGVGLHRLSAGPSYTQPPEHLGPAIRIPPNTYTVYSPIFRRPVTQRLPISPGDRRPPPALNEAAPKPWPHPHPMVIATSMPDSPSTPQRIVEEHPVDPAPCDCGPTRSRRLRRSTSRGPPSAAKQSPHCHCERSEAISPLSLRAQRSNLKDGKQSKRITVPTAWGMPRRRLPHYLPRYPRS